MNRLIEFRGLNSENKWLYGSLLIPNNVFPYHFIVNERNGNDMVIENTVGQFTGLIDSKGVKIYEGDKIKRFNNDWGIIVYKAPFFEVTVSETESCFYTREWFEEVEVIGNIHEK